MQRKGERSRNPTRKAAESSINFDNILNIDSINQTIKDTCNPNEIQNVLTAVKARVAQYEKNIGLMTDLEGFMKKLNIRPGGGAKRDNDDAPKRRRDKDDPDADSQMTKRPRHEPVDGNVDAVALLIAVMENDLTQMKQLEDAKSKEMKQLEDAKPIEMKQLEDAKSNETKNMSNIFGYVTGVLVRTSQAVDNCVAYVLTDTVKNALLTYIIGSMALHAGSNPGYAITKLYQLATFATPHVFTGAAGTLTLAIGMIIKKVIEFYANAIPTTVTGATYKIKELHTKLDKMAPEEVVNMLKGNSIEFMNAVQNSTTPLPETELKKMMKDIKNGLATPEPKRIAELSKPLLIGNGKKSNKRYTNNNKNKPRKTKKNKHPLKKKAHKKK
tara:strand:+ start:1490 stop:2644 length:1155 start_codon:yes stop_codon:yes gene_type:complete